LDFFLVIRNDGLEAATRNVCSSALRGCFLKSTGETPHQFVLRNKIERAKEMLRAPETRILDVAVACGFKTQQHFARVFRLLSGTSPREYRMEWWSRDLLEGRQSGNPPTDPISILQ